MSLVTAHLRRPASRHRAGSAGVLVAWAELLRRTICVDPEICGCGARMVVDDAITEPEKIMEILARLGV